MMARLAVLCCLIAVAYCATSSEELFDKLEEASELIEIDESAWVDEQQITIQCYAGGDDASRKKSNFTPNVFTPEFNRIGGGIRHVSTRGDEVWITKVDQSIHRYKNGKWQRMPGAANQVGASPDGYAWAVTAAQQIYRYNPVKNDWEHIPGSLVMVNALSKDEAIGVNRNRVVFHYYGGQWHAMPRGTPKAPGPGLGNGAIWASIGKGGEIWAIGPYTGIWRWNAAQKKWIAQNGRGWTVDVHSPGRIIVTNKAPTAYHRVGNKWQHIAGTVARRASIGENVLITLNGNYATGGFLSAIAF